MKLEVKYLFPTSSSGANLCIYKLLEGLGMGKLLTHSIRMEKNSQTRTEIFWIFTDFHMPVGSRTPAWKFKEERCQPRNRLS